jgi:hypothetical protein
MRRLLLAPALAAVFCGCGEQLLHPGGYKSGLVVECEGPTAAEAKRAAVSGVFDLYLTTGAIAAEQEALKAKVLDQAASFVTREKVVSKKGRTPVRLRALVATDKLGRALDGMGLVRPAGVAEHPLVLIRVVESGPGAGAFSSSEALRRALAAKGYSAVDVSSSTKDAANAQAAKLKSGVLVMGSAKTRLTDDARLEGLRAVAAKLELKALAAPEARSLDELTTETASIDAKPEAAGERALSAAGEISAAKLRQTLTERYHERGELTVLFAGVGGLDKARKLARDLRADRAVVAASFDSLVDDDAKFRVFVENMSADELASELSRLPGYAFSVRSVEADYRYLEMESPHAF